MNDLQNAGSALKALRILHAALMIGMIMFAAIIYFISSDASSTPVTAYHREVLLAALFFAVICLSVSSFLWKKDLNKIQQNAVTLAAKFDMYRTAAIKRYAFTEAAGLFSIICYFLTQELKLLIVAGMMILHMRTLMPSATKIASQIGENAEDIEKL